LTSEISTAVKLPQSDGLSWKYSMSYTTLLNQTVWLSLYVLIALKLRLNLAGMRIRTRTRFQRHHRWVL